MKTLAIVLLTASSVIGATVVGAAGETAFSIRLEKQEEIEMALSAAPEHLRDKAGVYVLGVSTYDRVRESRNGFNCFVERDGASTMGPICFDGVGSATLLPAQLRRAALVLSGSTLAEASKIVESEFRTGTLKAPDKAGIAYMLSSDFCQRDPETGEMKSLYPPHVMFYAPYVRNVDLGLKEDQVGSTKHPWVLNEGTASAYIIVVPQH